MNIGVYRLTWSTCPKVYYGASKNLRQRKSRHFCDLKKGRHDSPLVQEAYEEHGMPEFEVLLTCEKEDLDYYEGVLLKLAEGEGNSLNKNFDPTGKGKVPTEEHRKKQSAAMKGRVFSDAHIENLRIANLGEKNPMFGKFLGKNPSAKKVIDTETGDIFDSAKELVLAGKVNLNYAAFSAALVGKSPNLTPYEYLNTYIANGNKKREARVKRKPGAREVININTLEVYSSAKEVYTLGLTGMQYINFLTKLNGIAKTNPTPFMYLENYNKQNENYDIETSTPKGSRKVQHSN